MPPPPPSNSAPVLTGNLSPSFAENQVVSFFLSVDDADGDTVTVTIGNSADGQFFTLDTGSGEIRSTQPFDFEMPQDTNGDNIYVQSVTLDDGTNTVQTQVQVSITNVDEAPVCAVVGAVLIPVEENFQGVIGILSASDPDAGDDDIAVFENLSTSDLRLDGQVSIDSSTGEISLDGPLDAEAFADEFSFSVAADYRANALSARCSLSFLLENLPSRVTSGILFADNLKNVQRLTDFDGDGIDEFWMADAPDTTGTEPIRGRIIFGASLMEVIAATGGAELDVGALNDAQRLMLAVAFSNGPANARTATLLPLADIDGDAIPELFVGTDQPINDGLDPTRRPWGYVVFSQTLAAAEDMLDLNSLQPAQGFSLTGPVDFNGGVASYVVADVDGLDGDEVVIALPEAIGDGSETGRLYVVSGASLAAANTNLDFDTDAATKTFTGPITPDEMLVIGGLSSIGDLDGDGVRELTMRSQTLVALFPSTTLIGSSAGLIDTLNPLLLDLEGQASGLLVSAEIDGDSTEDLLLVSGEGAAGTRQGATIFGTALTPIINSDATVALNGANFPLGSAVEFTSDGTGAPVGIIRLGDYDGDGRSELLYSLSENDGGSPASMYVVRGSVIAGAADTRLLIDQLDDTESVEIVGVPNVFASLSTLVDLAPDIDGDGLAELYITSDVVLADDPPGRGLILKSTDVEAALASGTPVSLEALLFNETPP
ncbi:MAG: hypothetical protein AAF529_12045 [Pseudomonadota bacterium]